MVGFAHQRTMSVTGVSLYGYVSGGYKLENIKPSLGATTKKVDHVCYDHRYKILAKLFNETEEELYLSLSRESPLLV